VSGNGRAADGVGLPHARGIGDERVSHYSCFNLYWSDVIARGDYHVIAATLVPAPAEIVTSNQVFGDQPAVLEALIPLDLPSPITAAQEVAVVADGEPTGALPVDVIAILANQLDLEAGDRGSHRSGGNRRCGWDTQICYHHAEFGEQRQDS
jgi:hypothetical protein